MVQEVQLSGILPGGTGVGGGGGIGVGAGGVGGGCAGDFIVTRTLSGRVHWGFGGGGAAGVGSHDSGAVSSTNPSTRSTLSGTNGHFGFHEQDEEGNPLWIEQLGRMDMAALDEEEIQPRRRRRSPESAVSSGRLGLCGRHSA